MALLSLMLLRGSRLLSEVELLEVEEELCNMSLMTLFNL
jgi:hypothetical protein